MRTPISIWAGRIAGPRRATTARPKNGVSEFRTEPGRVYVLTAR